jgi:hypothetical protein
MNKHFIIYTILVLIILYFVNNLLTKKSPAAPSSSGQSKPWTVYGTTGCGWTRKQLEVMDSKKVKYNFVNCDEENCDGMSAYPTLLDPNGVKTVGFNNLE